MLQSHQWNVSLVFDFFNDTPWNRIRKNCENWINVWSPLLIKISHFKTTINNPPIKFSIDRFQFAKHHLATEFLLSVLAFKRLCLETGKRCLQHCFLSRNSNIDFVKTSLCVFNEGFSPCFSTGKGYLTDQQCVGFLATETSFSEIVKKCKLVWVVSINKLDSIQNNCNIFCHHGVS